MAGIPPSSTSVSSGSKSPRFSASRTNGSGVRQRKVASNSTNTRVRTTQASGGTWKFYSDDSPGIKVGPVPVLVMSLVFIASVFMLHIWGKYTRA